MRAIPARIDRVSCLFAFAVLCCGAASAEEGIARLSEFSGEVSIQRGEEIITPALVGKLIRNATLIDRDMVQTRKGSATVLFEDGSHLKLQEDTLIVINPPTEQIKQAAAQGAAERRIRIVVGKVWNYIEPKSTTKTLFELPDGVAAVRGSSSLFHVTWNGSYQLTVESGTYLPTQLSANVSWEQTAGRDVWVERVQGGIRIRNAAGSSGPITLTFSPGGQTKTLAPGESIFIPLKSGVVQLAGLSPFPFRTSHRFPWQLAVSQDVQRPGFWVTQPIYIRDYRRDAELQNTRIARSIFNRELNRGYIRQGGSPSGHCQGSGGMGFVTPRKGRD